MMVAVKVVVEQRIQAGGGVSHEKTKNRGERGQKVVKGK